MSRPLDPQYQSPTFWASQILFQVLFYVVQILYKWLTQTFVGYTSQLEIEHGSDIYFSEKKEKKEDLPL